jgi:hypothetical protein
MPGNGSGVRIDPTAWNTLDGYSPGTMMLVNFPQGVDLAASVVPPLTNFALSVGSASATVLLDADTLERIEHFGENDVSIATNGMPVAPPMQGFIIRPGRRLKNNGTISLPFDIWSIRRSDPTDLPSRPARRYPVGQRRVEAAGSRASSRRSRRGAAARSGLGVPAPRAMTPFKLAAVDARRDLRRWASTRRRAAVEDDPFGIRASAAVLGTSVPL